MIDFGLWNMVLMAGVRVRGLGYRGGAFRSAMNRLKQCFDEIRRGYEGLLGEEL